MENEKHSSFHRSDLRPHEEHLYKTSEGAKLKQYGENVSSVLRQMTPHYIQTFNDYRGVSEASLENTAAAIQETFRELARFDIYISLTHVISDKDSDDSLFAVTKNVQGVSIWKDEDKAAEEYSRTLARLISYFEEKQADKSYYLLDIVGPQQFVYGTVAEDPEPHLYLVDVDPLVTKGPLPVDAIIYLKDFIPLLLRRENFPSLIQRIDNLRLPTPSPLDGGPKRT